MTTETRPRVRGSARPSVQVDQGLADWRRMVEPDWLQGRQTPSSGVPLDQLSDVWAKAFVNALGATGKVSISYRSPSLDRYVFSSEQELQHRLDNANDYFGRKASEVLNDEAALKLLAALYQLGVIETSDIDWCESGIPVAKLTAANFCQIGAKVVYVTESGQRFIESIRDA